MSDAHAFLADYAASTEVAHTRLLALVGEDRGAQIEDVARPGAHGTAARLAALQVGRRLSGASRATMVERQFVQPAGVEDLEVVGSRRFQGVFVRLLGEARLEDLDAHMRGIGDWPVSGA